MKEEKKRLMDNRIVKKAIKHKIFLSVLSVFLVFIFLSYFLHGFIYSLVNNKIDNIIYFIYSFGSWSVIIFMILIIFEVILAPVPGLILNVAGGWIFGSLFGSILVLIGNIIGASICYFIAKYIGGNYFKKLIERKKGWRRYSKYIRKDGHYVLFLLRLNPLTSSDIFSYLAGFVNMKYKHFIISTTLGLIPLVFLLSYFGDYFINHSVIFRLIFFVVSILYFAIFFYGIYKIWKNGLKNGLKKNER